MFHVPVCAHPSCICFQWQPRKCKHSIRLTSGTLPFEAGGICNNMDHLWRAFRLMLLVSFSERDPEFTIQFLGNIQFDIKLTTALISHSFDGWRLATVRQPFLLLDYIACMTSKTF